MTDSLLALLYVALLASLAYTIGATLLRRVKEEIPALEKLVFALPLGLGIVSYAILGVGLLRYFRPPLFYGILGLGLLSVPLTLRDILRSRRQQTETKWTGILLVVGAALALLQLFIIIGALAPPSEWDAVSYHLAGPKTYLRHGRIFYIPYDHHTNFPFLLQMLYGLMLGVKSSGGAKLCHTLCGALTAVSIYTFAVRHLPENGHGRRVGAVAALIFLTTPMVIWEMTVAYSDLATTLYTWLAFYALLNARNSPARRGWFTISAVFIGFALGTKFTVLAYWLLLLAGIVGVDYLIARRLTGETIANAIRWCIVSLAVAAPWYVKTWLYTGNPTYPFLYGLFGGRYWNAANAAQYSRDQSALGTGKSLYDLVTIPWESTMLPDAALHHFTEYFTFSLSPIYIAVLLALPLLGRRVSAPVRMAGLFGLGVTAFWFLSVHQTRYLLPALPAFALVCAEAIVLLWETPRRWERWMLGALVGMTTVWGLYLAGGIAFWGVRDFTGARAARPAWPVVSGQESTEDYIRHALPGIGAAEWWINDETNTPRDAKVAIFDMTQGFYLDRDYVWAQPDHADGLIPWDAYRDVDDWLADFKRRGYTTLLLGPRDPNAADDGKRWRTLLAEAIRDDKVTLKFAEPAGRSATGEPIYVRVYTIP